MPIPSFKDTLQGTLGPGITIISGGNYFDAEDKVRDLDIAKMNQELAESSEGDEVVFMPAEPPKEDLSLQFFLSTQKKPKKG